MESVHYTITSLCLCMCHRPLARLVCQWCNHAIHLASHCFVCCYLCTIAVSLPLVIWLHVDETSPESLKVIQCRKHNWSGLICSMQVFSVILQKEN